MKIKFDEQDISAAMPFDNTLGERVQLMSEEERIALIEDSGFADILKETPYGSMPIEKRIIYTVQDLVFAGGIPCQEAKRIMDVVKVTNEIVITGREEHSVLYKKNEFIREHGDTLSNPFSDEEMAIRRIKYVEGERSWMKDIGQTLSVLSWLWENGVLREAVSSEKEEDLLREYNKLTFKEKSVVDCIGGMEEVKHRLKLSYPEIKGLNDFLRLRFQIENKFKEVLKE